MTRKQLAEAIYDISALSTAASMGIAVSPKSDWVRGILNGCGAAKPMKKQELVDWYNRLISEA